MIPILPAIPRRPRQQRVTVRCIHCGAPLTVRLWPWERVTVRWCACCRASTNHEAMP